MRGGGGEEGEGVRERKGRRKGKCRGEVRRGRGKGLQMASEQETNTAVSHLENR